MIGRYLALLDDEERKRVLTTPMYPGSYAAPCLVGTAEGYNACEYASKTYVFNTQWPGNHRITQRPFLGPKRSVECTYDELCLRYGTQWVNDRIRLKLLFGKGPAMSYQAVTNYSGELSSNVHTT